MKQHITKEQFSELSMENQVKLLSSIIKEDGDVEYFGRNAAVNIGTMIEFLDEKEYFNTHLNNIPYKSYAWKPEAILCDLLWEEVKKELEK